MSKFHIVSIFALVLSFGLNIPAAYASFGVSCEIKDDNLAFSFTTTFGGGTTGDWYQTEGSLELKAPAKDLVKEYKLTDVNLTQHWIDQEQVLVDFGYYDSRSELKLEINTKNVNEGEYKGKYSIDIYSYVYSKK